MKKICVLGNYSGRNAGDAALLGGLLEDVSSLYKDLLFVIPTITPSFVSRSFSRYCVRPVSLMPWNMSLKILGIPVLTSTLRADLILVTDAILFDLKLFNPLHNYLLTLSQVLPLAHRRGVPIVLYNMSLGPVRTALGKRCLMRVLRCADLVVIRDTDSRELVERLGGFEDKLRIGADCALNVVPSGDARLQEISRRERLFTGNRPSIGFNINSYIDAFLRRGAEKIERGEFIRIAAAVIDRTIESLGVDVVLVTTQVMDLGIAEELMRAVRCRERVAHVSNKEYSHGDLAGILSRLEIFVGMRTHSLILATAMGTPTAGIIAYPKNRGYLRSIGMGDQLIEFSDFSEENLWCLVERLWRERAQIRERLRPVIEQEKARARRSAELLRPYLT
ncbi:MAG: polysaccharide pyruvyl transferase family protein [Candidatus Aureabacteria bacterium]|nr:polysaccharide pyruvyl transferase family protein [Candidatus Auribacterota bacterium]